jgi:HAD superfamily hydrolase (TIGR01509 family)
MFRFAIHAEFEIISNMSKDSTTIKCIVFDIGRVLIHLHPEQSFTLYEKMGLDKDFLLNLFQQENFLYFERGMITEQEFYEYVLSHSKKDFDVIEFIKAWNAFLGTELEGINKLLQQLKQKYILCTLSNTNPIHWEAIKNYPVFKHFQRHFLSFQLGLHKPDPALYKEIIQKLNLKPQEILYLDDLRENVLEARSQGIESEIVRENLGQIKYALQKYRISL